ncbi:MAG: bifunctional precorrin-2 dehydrogenase/sirohydrochlorin ferrochelatase [Archaeoglobaceae archaeon]|nr:bifunctional precorrin-2 dehydrogenase/sirohydrochlorin ferrochelatase [Archaeoglobaceae archaeon]MDW7989313.1 bifunctional precorrin-2 dehydrogenase/sirohydrochlorin ferrochelatase [Archaeoglobaceae archaeon]
MRIPLFIEFSGKRVAIIGGGNVGTLRAKKFLRVGADVTIFSLEFSDELKKLEEEGKIRLIKRSVEKIGEELSEFDLVVVAIGDKNFNRKFIELSKKHRFLLNLANDAEKTEVVVPFEGGKDGIRFAVTTEGKSGVVARIVRDKFQTLLEKDGTIFTYLSAMEYLKKYMKSREIPINVRMRVYAIASSYKDLIRLSEEGKIEEAKRLLEKIVEEEVRKGEVRNSGF